MGLDATLNYFRAISIQRMVNHHLPKLLIALESLGSNDIRDQGGEESAGNSIGGIVLHIEQ